MFNMTSKINNNKDPNPFVSQSNNTFPLQTPSSSALSAIQNFAAKLKEQRAPSALKKDFIFNAIKHYKLNKNDVFDTKSGVLKYLGSDVYNPDDLSKDEFMNMALHRCKEMISMFEEAPVDLTQTVASRILELKSSKSHFNVVINLKNLFTQEEVINDSNGEIKELFTHLIKESKDSFYSMYLTNQIRDLTQNCTNQYKLDLLKKISDNGDYNVIFKKNHNLFNLITHDKHCELQLLEHVIKNLDCLKNGKVLKHIYSIISSDKISDPNNFKNYHYLLYEKFKENKTNATLIFNALGTKESKIDFIKQIRKNASAEEIEVFTTELCLQSPSYFFQMYPFLSSDSFSKRLEIAQKCLQEAPNIMARNISYIFTDQEVIDDSDGAISKIIDQCKKECAGTCDADHLECSERYFDLLKGKHTTKASSSSGDVNATYIPPGDSHLYLYLGQEPGDPKATEGNHLFMAKRKFDTEISRAYKHMNADIRGQENAASKNNEIQPATEIPSASFRDTLNYQTDHMRQLGYKILPGGNVFFVLPDPAVVEKRENALNPKSEPLSIYRSSGILASREFVKQHHTHEAVASTNEEYVHDQSHILEVLKLRDDPKYPQLRKDTEKITQEILDICDYVKAKSPSASDLDLVVFLETSAGIIYDTVTAKGLDGWRSILNLWNNGNFIEAFWWLSDNYWRDGLKSLVAHPENYPPKRIQEFWNQKKAEYTSSINDASSSSPPLPELPVKGAGPT